MLLILSYLTIFTPSQGSDLVEIKWNLSKNMQTIKQYPDFKEENHTCDLTAGVCDSWCCSDQDCSFWQKQSFKCYENDIPQPHSVFSCSAKEQPRWMTMACYVYDNSPFLGLYFYPIRPIEDLKALKNVFPQRFDAVETPLRSYRYGDPVLTTGDTKTPRPLVIKNTFIGSTTSCTNFPVTYLNNSTAECEEELSAQACEEGFALSPLPYLLKTNFSDQGLAIVTDVLPLKTTPAQVFITNISNGHTFSNLTDVSFLKTRFNSHLNVCENVLLSAHFYFLTYGNTITNVSAWYNISMVRIQDKVSRPFSQKFTVTFRDFSANEKCESCVLERAYKNRGYFIGEELVVGYIRDNGTRVWAPGHLRTFTNGGDCTDLKPITFAFDISSFCILKLSSKNSRNCTDIWAQFRIVFAEMFSGDYIAPYQQFQEPWLDPVPLLRENLVEKSNSSNGTCEVPGSASVVLLYTSAPVDGRLVHRIVGANLVFKYQNVSSSGHLRFSSSITFARIPLKDPPRLSRFWEKVLSPEGRSFAWLNLFTALDEDGTGDENAEIVFWTSLLIFSSLLFLIIGGNQI